jgi:hypothetical protein
MPVTFHPSDKPLQPVRGWDNWKSPYVLERIPDPNPSPARKVLHSVCHEISDRADEILQSSFQSEDDIKHFRPNRNGFVNAVVDAYNRDHALTIRPDDVWLSILTQFSYYVNGNAEQMRRCVSSCLSIHALAHE